MSARRRLQLLARYLWAAPASIGGLLLAVPACLLGAKLRAHDGVLEVTGGLAGRIAAGTPGARRFVALTLGHVLFGRSRDILAGLRAHEHEHVRQYERWGPLFIPLYIASGVEQWVRGRSFYWHNAFERAARAAEQVTPSSPGPSSFLRRESP